MLLLVTSFFQNRDLMLEDSRIQGYKDFKYYRRYYRRFYRRYYRSYKDII